MASEGYLPCGCHHNAILGGRSPIHPHLTDAQLRGKRNHRRGDRQDLAAARKYGGGKIYNAQPADFMGAEFATQVKSHMAAPPVGWTRIFAALDGWLTGQNQVPRILVRYIQPGRPTEDFFIIRGRDWLDHFGRDE